MTKYGWSLCVPRQKWKIDMCQIANVIAWAKNIKFCLCLWHLPKSDWRLRLRMMKFLVYFNECCAKQYNNLRTTVNHSLDSKLSTNIDIFYNKRQTFFQILTIESDFCNSLISLFGSSNGFIGAHKKSQVLRTSAFLNG